MLITCYDVRKQWATPQCVFVKHKTPVDTKDSIELVKKLLIKIFKLFYNNKIEKGLFIIFNYLVDQLSLVTAFYTNETQCIALLLPVLVSNRNVNSN